MTPPLAKRPPTEVRKAAAALLAAAAAGGLASACAIASVPLAVFAVCRPCRLSQPSLPEIVLRSFVVSWGSY